MKKHPELTLEHTAYESGFNSISTFRRTFMKLTEKTPSKFKKSQLAEKASLFLDIRQKIINFDHFESIFVRQNQQKNLFFWLCAHLFVSLQPFWD